MIPRSERPEDPLAQTSPTGMDFDRRGALSPFGLVVSIFADHLRQTDKTASFTAGDETVILADATAGQIIITLPAASGKANKWYWIKKVDSTPNIVTIDGNAAEEIDGEQTVVLSLQYQYIVIICDGAAWHIIGGEYVRIDELLRQMLLELQSIKEVAQKSAKELETIAS